MACFWPANRDVCLLFFVRCENFALYHNKRLLRADPCCRSVIKEFAHAFNCAYIELWMLLGSLKSTQNALLALGCASSYSHAFSCSPNFLRAPITRYTHAKHEQILNFYIAADVKFSYYIMNVYSFSYVETFFRNNFPSFCFVTASRQLRDPVLSLPIVLAMVK